MDYSCTSEDLKSAYDDIMQRLAERRARLWDAYRSATDAMSPGEYDDHEHECWSVLQAGIAGIDAEERAVRREYERRRPRYDEHGGSVRDHVS